MPCPGFTFKGKGALHPAFPVGWNRRVMSGVIAAMLDHEEEAHVMWQSNKIEGIWVPDTNLHFYVKQRQNSTLRKGYLGAGAGGIGVTLFFVEPNKPPV